MIHSLNPRADQSTLEGIPQVGEKYFTFVLEQIAIAREKLAHMSSIAELAADRIVFRDGQLLSAGDEGFSSTPAWRAGGICFSKMYDPAKPTESRPSETENSKESLPYYRTPDFAAHYVVGETTSNDVVLLGYENEKEEDLRLWQSIQQLLAAGSLVVLFSSEIIARKVETQFGKHESLVFITHSVPDAGIIQIPGWHEKICSGRSFVVRLYLWLFEAELIGAFLRRGKMPGILLSVTYEHPQVFNIPLINNYRFIPSFNVTPIRKGVLGETYLAHLANIFETILPGQRQKILQASAWMAKAVRDKKKVFALLIHGLMPSGLPGDPGLFDVHSEGNAYYPILEKAVPGDVAIHLGYNWYPTDLAKMVDKAGAKLILCATFVQDLPPRPVVYGEGGEMLHFTSLAQVPTRENHIFIDIKFSQYDATLKIPGYPVLAIPTSDLTENAVYWMFVANTVEMLAAK
jgi:hypothetical protein